MEFKKVKLGEIAKFNQKSYKSNYNWKTVKYLDTGNLNKNKVENLTTFNLRKEKLPSRAKRIPQINSILYSTVRPNQEHYGILENKFDNLLVSTGFTVIDIYKENINPKYIYYFLTKKDITAYLQKIAEDSVSTYPAIKPSDIKNLEILLPNRNNQDKIEQILSNLDSKIEINNKIISNLESQAQAIFKSWFVDFEPFQDGNFVESELGMIPEGWEVRSLSDIAFFKNGLAMQKYRPEINEPSLPVLKIRELNSGSTDFSSDRCRTDIDDSVKVYDGDLIFSWSGTLSCKLWTGGNAGLNQHLFKVTSEKYEKWFNYSWVKFHMNKFIRIAQDKATTMGHIKRSHLDEAKVLIPAIDIYGKIDKLMKPIIELIIKLGIQNTKLAELRDALLPKLMAGEIDVSNIKIEGEEVKNE